MSRLRARCPDCRTFTAVAIGPGYECHSCGREYGAGLVRVPQAWGEGGESMAEAARLPLPFPEAAVVEEETLDEQTLAVAIDLPERPLVLGGCCCAHIGAVEALAARNGRIALVWIDAHGDLNTVESSPSGNLWATPFRMILESGAVDPQDAILLGARSLDPPEREYIASIGLRTDIEELEEALDGTAGVYVALDVDVFEPGEMQPFMPEPGGLTLAEAEQLFGQVRERTTILGAGFSALAAEPDERRAADPAGAGAGAVTPGRGGRSKLASSCLNASTSPSSIDTRRPPTVGSPTRTRARAVTRTTATTSSRRRSTSARSAVTTFPCTLATGSPS